MSSTLVSTAASYEYLTVTTGRELEPTATATFRRFGLVLEERTDSPADSNDVSLELRRDSQLPNRHRVLALQSTAEQALDEIASLERSLVTRANACSWGLATAGFGLLAGSVVALTAGSTLLALVLAALGIAGWTAGFLANERLRRDTSAELSPLIRQRYELARTTSEEAARLLV